MTAVWEEMGLLVVGGLLAEGYTPAAAACSTASASQLAEVLLEEEVEVPLVLLPPLLLQLLPPLPSLQRTTCYCERPQLVDGPAVLQRSRSVRLLQSLCRR